MLSASRRPTDRGSVAMVVMIAAVIASLAAITVSRVAFDGRVIAGGEDRTVARHAADRGVAVARAGIAAGMTEGFGTRESLARGRYEVRAVPLDEQVWEIESTGTSEPVSVAVRARVAPDPDGIWRLVEWEERVVER